MNPNICIPPELIETIKNSILTPDGNSLDNSINREKKLLEIFGGNSEMASQINLAFEKAILSKNQERAIKRFSEKFTQTGIDKQSEINKKIADALKARKDKVLTKDDFLTIAQQTLKKQKKVDVSLESMQAIQKIKREAAQLEDAYNANPTNESRMAWGRKEIEYQDFINNLKERDSGISQFFKDTSSRIKEVYKEKGILPAVGQTGLEVVDTAFSGAYKAFKSTADMSAPLRQGVKVLTANPKIWKNRTIESAKLWKNLFSKESIEQAGKDFRANVISDPQYKDMVDSGLRITGIEDFFPENPLMKTDVKIPVIKQVFQGLKNMFKVSDEAYTQFVQGARMDLFKNYIDTYKLTNGIAPDKEVMKGFARVANSVTGSGGLGKFEANAGALNRALYSARYQMANINTVAHAFDPTLPKEAQKIAQKNLAKHVLALSAMLGTLSMFGDVGLNPKEKTFGKVRIGDSKKWTDVTGGLASYLVPIFQVADKLSDGKPNKYGAESGKDILLGFLEGKLAPAPGAFRDILDERAYGKDKVTPFSVLSSLFVPITAENVFETYTSDKDKADTLEKVFSTISDFFGAGVSQPKAKRPGSYKSALDIITGK